MTRAQRRTPLRRMPTELMLTTRMQPFRHSDKPGSDVRPISEVPAEALPPSEPQPAPFDRRPTAPIPKEAVSEAAKEVAELIELVDEREATLHAAELAQTVAPVRPRRRTPVPPPPAPVTAVARYAIEANDQDQFPKQSVRPTGRHAAPQQDTSSGEFATAHAAASGGYAPANPHPERRSPPPPPPRHAVAYGPAPMHRADANGGYAAAAPDLRAYEEPSAQHVAASFAHAAAPMHRANEAGGYAAAAMHQAAANGDYSPTPPRRASSTQWRAPNLWEAEPDGHYTGNTRPDDDLTQVRRQLAAALESARKHEQRAREAELRASWAERYVPQLQDPELEQRAEQRQKRLRWIKRVLEISCVGLALGGYISLLVPVRERVIAQDAMIQQLTTLQQQLREEKRALQQRIEEMQAGEATTPP